MRFVPPQGTKRVGQLADGHVARVFRLAEPGIKACYDAQVERRPGLRGTISLSLVVATDGRVRHLTVEGDELAVPALTACVTAEVQKLVFPAPEFGGEADVRFPIRFEPPPKPRP